MNRYHLSILTGIVASPLIVQQVLAQPSFYTEARQSVVLIQNENGGREGTGFIVDKDSNTYYVLTANHVVQDKNKKFSIRTDLGDVISVDAIYPLPGVDLALLQFRSNSSISYHEARLANNANGIQPLTRIYVLGYPANPSSNLEVPGGNVTSRQSFNPPSGTITYSVETKPGMSGSPVLNESGEVIGIHIGLPTPDDFRVAIPIERYRELVPSIFIQSAIGNLARGNFSQVIESIEQGRRIGQGSSQAQSILAYAYFGLGNFERTRSEANQLGRSNPNVALLIGATDYLDGNFSRSIEILRTIANRDTATGVYASAILGLSHAYMASPDRAQANNNAGIAVDSLRDDFFVNLARSCVRYKLDGERERARIDLESVSRLARQPLGDPFLSVVISRVQQRVENECLQGLSIPQTVVIGTGRYEIREKVDLDSGVTAIAVSPNNQLVTAGLRDGTVITYDLNRRVKSTLASGQDRVNSIAFSPDGSNIAIATANGEIRVFDVQSRSQRYNVPNAGDSPFIVFSNNSRLLFVGSNSGTLSMIDNRSGIVQISNTSSHPRGITSIALHGGLLATGGGDGIVRLWRTSDLIISDSYQPHPEIVQSLIFSNDGSQIISNDFDTVKSCNLQSKQCVDVARSKQVIRSLAVASNGHLAYSAEKEIFLEDQRTKQSLGKLSGHSDQVDSLAYISNDDLLISGSFDGTMIIWKVR